MDRKELIGKAFPPIRCTTDEETVSAFMRVTGDEHEAYCSDAGARKSGYERRVIPPSYGPCLALLFRSFDWEKDFSLDLRTGTVVFGEQELEYGRPLHFNEVFMVQGTVVDVSEKKGKKLFDVITMKFVAADEKGQTAFQGSYTLIIFK